MLALVLAAHVASAAADPAIAPLTTDPRASLQTIAQEQLTPDGRWLVYATRPLIGEMRAPRRVVIKSTTDSTERTLEAGSFKAGGTGLTVSPGGRWVAFKVTAQDDKSPPSLASLAIVEIDGGRRLDIPAVERFAFGGLTTKGDSDEWVAVLRANDAVATGSEPRDFVLQRLSASPAGESPPTVVRGVTEFAFNARGDAIAVAGEGVLPAGIAVFDLGGRGAPAVLPAKVWVSSGKVSKLTWTPSGRALAAFCTQAGDAVSLLVMSGIDSGRPQLKEYSPPTVEEFPARFTISAESVLFSGRDQRYEARAALVWRADERGIFFGIKAPPAAEPGRTPANLVLWHSEDVRLPGHREKFARNDKSYSYLSFVALDSARVVRLADDALRQVEPHSRSMYLLAYDQRAYQRTLDTLGRHFRDYYLVDLRSGARKRILEKLPIAVGPFVPGPEMSPDGRSVLYVDGAGNLIRLAVPTGAITDLTASLPAKIYNPSYYWTLTQKDELHDHPHGVSRLVWTRDGAHVLVRDKTDLWLLSFDGAAPRNLTAGWVENGLFWLPEFELGADNPPDLKKPLYVQFVDTLTKAAGLGRIDMTTAKRRVLMREDAALEFSKASRAEVFTFTRQTAIEFPDRYRVTGDWQGTRRLTDLNAEYRASGQRSPSRLISYRSKEGQLLQAVLHLPVNYQPGKEYPTLVDVYERQDGEYHYPLYSEPSGFGDAFHFTQRGYAVLRPSYHVREGGTGQAALDGILAAIDASAATGIVDKDRLGLTGQSYGGYTTNFLVTQTSIFKAAMPVAGTANLWNGVSHVYGGTVPRSGLAYNQPYMSSPPWVDPKPYVENSPLYYAQNVRTPLLFVHGTKDEATPLYDVVHFFNTLRALGKTQVVLLEYRDEGHVPGMRGPNRIDLIVRADQFFDHFLKGAPAPGWWSEGVSYPAGTVPAADARSE